MKRTLHVSISTEAREILRRSLAQENRAGRTLRDWLVRSFEAAAPSRTQQVSLFAETISVDDDVPLLLEALARVTRQTPDDLVDAWVLEEPVPDEDAKQTRATAQYVRLPDDVRGQIAELLDLVETLFEETVLDAQQRLESYPEGLEAEQSAAEIYRALRSVLGLLGE